MATRLFGGVKAGATGVSLDALLLKTADGTPDTGKVAADLTAYYYRQGASATAPVTLADLAALNTAWAGGGVKPIGDGSYRVDWPDAAFAAGADWVELTVKDGTTSLYKERVAVESAGIADVAATLAAGVLVGGYAAGMDPAAQVLDAATSDHATAGTAGAALGGGAATELCAGATSTTITLQAGTALSSLPAAPAEAWVTVTGGAGAGTSARVLSLSGRVATVAGWPLGQPDTASSYEVTATPDGRLRLGPDGLDAVAVEAGVNARQALSLILAPAAGVLSGADTGTVVIKGGNVATTRIAATCDDSGNRTAVTLTPPA